MQSDRGFTHLPAICIERPWITSKMLIRASLLLLVSGWALPIELASAQLPPAIQVDRYMVQAEREIAIGDYTAAVAALDKIVELQAEHDLEIPVTFWYERAQIAANAGQYGKAIDSVTIYLTMSGQEGDHYRAALELLDAAEHQSAVLELTPEMVEIPAGVFRMGCVSGQRCSDQEEPVHEVRIARPFAISKYEVTFADWQTCLDGGGCNGYSPEDSGWGRADRPVINVSWNDAQAYLSWLSQETGEQYRLPSEAEWEYAARAGAATAYTWGNRIGRNLANCQGCRSQWDNDQTAPVGSFPENAFGLHDMHGNVWEWVQDCWNGSYEGAPTDGRAWEVRDCEFRVLRGGAWNTQTRWVRSAHRMASATPVRAYGFRIARTVSP